MDLVQKYICNGRLIDMGCLRVLSINWPFVPLYHTWRLQYDRSLRIVSSLQVSYNFRKSSLLKQIGLADTDRLTQYYLCTFVFASLIDGVYYHLLPVYVCLPLQKTLRFDLHLQIWKEINI